MTRTTRLLLALGPAVLLSACGDLPRPFQNNPGATAARLSRPPPARLAVPVPAASLLSDGSARDWATATATALVDNEFPAVADAAHTGDWRVALSAELRDGAVTPRYQVLNAGGADEGSVNGQPVPAARWAEGDAATLTRSASEAAPKIADLMTSIEAARQRSDPNSLLNRPARLYVPDATGAPGDGNTMLAKQMRLRLPQDGQVVQPQEAGADYTVRGIVHVSPGASGTQRVEIEWVVTDDRGREGGRILQINEIPSGSLSHYWGDVAVEVARQAASGVHDVITNQLVTHRQPRSGGEKPAS